MLLLGLDSGNFSMIYVESRGSSYWGMAWMNWHVLFRDNCQSFALSTLPTQIIYVDWTILSFFLNVTVVTKKIMILVDIKWYLHDTHTHIFRFWWAQNPPWAQQHFPMQKWSDDPRKSGRIGSVSPLRLIQIHCGVTNHDIPTMILGKLYIIYIYIYKYIYIYISTMG